MENAKAEALIETGPSVAGEGAKGGQGFPQKGSCEQCPYASDCPALRGEGCANPIRTWVELPTPNA